jgi:hypothetical protein
MATADRISQPIRTDSVFFPVMAVVMALTVFVGFARTFYLKTVFQPPMTLSTLMIVHGLAFTTWIAVLVTQTSLVAADRRDLHVRLGVFGTCLAAVMIVLGTWLAIDALRRGQAPHGAPSAAAFFAIPMAAMVAFPMLVTAGVLNHDRPAWHKRFMILSSAALLPAAVARIPLSFIETGGPPVFFGLTDLFILAVAFYDLTTTRRVHPATLWAGAIIIFMQPLSLIVGATPAWHALTDWLIH